MLAGQTSAELENDINQLEASSIVKDFRKSAGPDHLSGKASEKGSLMTNWITYKKRLKGALRRSNVVYKFCFTASTNCEVSVDHVNAIPAGHAMRELLYDVISLTTSDIALGIVGRHEATLDGGEALKELEAKFITGSYKERADIKAEILGTNFGRDDPEDKLMELETLMATRHSQTGSYDDAERISDLIYILKKTPEYGEFLRSHNFLVSSGMTMTCSQFVTAITDHWKDTISTDESKKKKIPNAGGAEPEASPPDGTESKGKGGKGAKGSKGSKGGKGSKGKGKGSSDRWSYKGGKGQRFGGYNQAQAGAAAQSGGGRGLPNSTNRVEDDPRCTWTCPICGPMESVNEWTEGKMHFPDQCPVRSAMRTSYQNSQQNHQDQVAGAGAVGGGAQLDGNREQEVSFDSVHGLMLGAEAEEFCQECAEDDSEIYPEDYEKSEKIKSMEMEEIETAKNLSLYGTPFKQEKLEETESEDESEDEISFLPDIADSKPNSGWSMIGKRCTRYPRQ